MVVVVDLGGQLSGWAHMIRWLGRTGQLAVLGEVLLRGSELLTAHCHIACTAGTDRVLQLEGTRPSTQLERISTPSHERHQGLSPLTGVTETVSLLSRSVDRLSTANHYEVTARGGARGQILGVQYCLHVDGRAVSQIPFRPSYCCSES